MGAFLEAVAKAIGLADFLARWRKREEEKTDDFKIARGADLEAMAQQQQAAAANRDKLRALSDDQLNERLRRDGAGH